MVWAVVWSARAGDTVESAARTATATTVRLLRIMWVLPNRWVGSGARRLSWSSRSRRTPAPRQTTISEEAYAGEVLTASRPSTGRAALRLVRTPARGRCASWSVGLPAVVAGTGAALVPASPPRPAQPVPTIAGRPAGLGRAQVLDLVAGQRDEPQRWWVAGVLGDRGHHQEGVRQHGQGYPPIPGAPAPDLMLVQAAQSLAGLERLLDPPAGPGHPDQGDQRQAGWAGAYVVRQFSGAKAAADQQPALPALRRAGGGQRHPAPPIPAAALGALAGADAQPARRRDVLGQPGRRRARPGVRRRQR